MKEQLTTAQKQNRKYEKYDTHPLYPQPNPYKNEPSSYLSIAPHHMWYNTMIVISLAQMRQSNVSGSVRNNEISILHLRSGAGT